MKSKDIILNTNKNLAIIKLYNLLKISIYIIIKNSRIDTLVISKARFVILVYLFLAISIKQINLSLDRDLIFELK